MSEYDSDIEAAADVLRRGGVILYPTDTVWGIGCDACNARAVKRVYAIKRRDDAKALITLVDSTESLCRLVDGVPDVAAQLIEYSTRPLTIVYDGVRHSARIAPNLTASDGTIAVRVTSEAFSRSLCRKFGRPLVSTSANVSGQPTPATFSQISPEILSAVDYVCHSRRNDNTPAAPSTVMRIEADGKFKILRS